MPSMGALVSIAGWSRALVILAGRTMALRRTWRPTAWACSQRSPMMRSAREPAPLSTPQSIGRPECACLTAPRPPCWLRRCSLEVSLPLQGRPCGRPPAALRPSSDTTVTGSRPHRPAQPAPTPHPDRHVVLTRFRACQRKGPGRCRLQRRDLAGVWLGGASVSGRQRRFERRLPRRLWRSRWARRFPMAEPACWAISSRKARSGSQRISKRHPASSHHKDRVHTLAPRPTRGIGLKGGTGNKKRPACARRSRRWPLLGTLRRLHAGV
jgi:hypothetical protein